MWLINNNASCDNRVLRLLLGPSAGLYGIAKRSSLTARSQAHCSAFERRADGELKDREKRGRGEQKKSERKAEEERKESEGRANAK